MSAGDWIGLGLIVLYGVVLVWSSPGWRGKR